MATLSEVRQADDNRLKSQLARHRKQHRDDAALRGKIGAEIVEQVRGKRVHVDGGRINLTPVLEASLIRHSLTTSGPNEADVFVVAAPGRCTNQLALATRLRGAFQVTPAILTTDGAEGVAAKWQVVAAIHREIYVSDELNARHGHAVRVMQDVLASMASCKTTLVVGGGWDALVALQVKHAAQKATLIALVCKDELHVPVWRCVAGNFDVLVSARARRVHVENAGLARCVC